MDSSNDVKIGNKRYGDYKFRWILITLKAIVIVAYLGFNIFVRKAIVPFVRFALLRSPSRKSRGTSRA